MNHSLPLREQLKALEKLQEVDLKIDSLKKKQAELPAALRTLIGTSQRLKLALDAKKTAIGEIEKVQHQTLAALDLNKDRLKRSFSKLEAVHNTQEFQAANKEIDQLKKLNTSLEEQLKKSGKEIDALKQELAQVEEEFLKVQGELDSQNTQLSGVNRELAVEVETLLQERNQYATQIEKRVLSQYDRTRAARGGLGCVPALGERCKGCHMMIPPQLYNEIQKFKNIQVCPSCHRILFVPQNEEVVASAGSADQAPAPSASEPKKTE